MHLANYTFHHKLVSKEVFLVPRMNHVHVTLSEIQQVFSRLSRGKDSAMSAASLTGQTFRGGEGNVWALMPRFHGRAPRS